MKGLKRTLTMVKVFKIFSNIEYIFMIIGGFLLLVCFVLLLAFNRNEELMAMINDNLNTSYSKLTLSSFIALVSTIIFGYICYRRYKMYSSICESEIPFSRKVVKEMRINGIMVMCAVLVVSIIYAIASAIFKTKLDIDTSSTFGFGLGMLLLSIPVEYGVEILENKNNDSKMENL